MNLSRKTLLYSTIISIIIVSLIIGYFILMLPSLYVDHMQRRNYNAVLAIQEAYMKERSYDNLAVKNPTGTFTADIPLSGNKFYVVGKFFRIEVDLKDQELIDMLNKLRYYAKNTDEIEEIDKNDFDFSDIKDKLLSENTALKDYPFDFKVETKENFEVFKEVSSKYHKISNSLIIYESNVTDGQNYYTSYIALGTTEDRIMITLQSIMTPRMDEIKPVILQSMPMIIAVACLLVLISSQVFAKLIVNPIIRLADHANYLKEAKNGELEPIIVSGHDEISVLAESLNKLYERLQENYQELEVKNLTLAEENKRQEVFLRASSHQLKTPITAALLLVQGMINEVGKYKNVKEYLPQVKEQLQSMQKIVEDILYLNHCSRNLNVEKVSLEQIVKECLDSYLVQIAEKGHTVNQDGSMPQLDTDRELIKKIIDNLLSNAINYTPDSGKIHIKYEPNKLKIINEGASIDDEILPHIFEPFVTSNSGNKGHGLGLYVVAYYAQFLGCKVKVTNTEGSVTAELIFA